MSNRDVDGAERREERRGTPRGLGLLPRATLRGVRCRTRTAPEPVSVTEGAEEEDAEEEAVAEGAREQGAMEGSGKGRGAAAQGAVPVGETAVAVGIVVDEEGAGACQ